MKEFDVCCRIEKEAVMAINFHANDLICNDGVKLKCDNEELRDQIYDELSKCDIIATKVVGNGIIICGCSNVTMEVQTINEQLELYKLIMFKVVRDKRVLRVK